MQFLFVKLASMLVMCHMACGCAWHHGLGIAADCQHHLHSQASNEQVEPTSVSHRCCHHHGQHSDEHNTEPVVSVADHMADHLDAKPSNHGHHHGQCHDDRCKVNVVSYRELTQGRLAELASCSVAIVNALPIDNALNRVGNSTAILSARVFAPGVRAHLLLGVQII